MGILVKNSDFELLWGEEYPSIAFDNTSYSLAGEVGTTLSASFAVFDNNDEDVTDQCEITLSNDNVSIENGMFICDDLEVGTYTTEVTATYSYLSATVTATATINISVEEEKATSIAFSESSYSMNGSEYGALSTQFSVEDNLGNDITSLCAYSFSPNDKGLYAEGGYFKVDSATAGIYNITVTATYGELTNTATISMAVVDYPDSISFDSASYSMSGTEGDTITQSFTVTDDLSHDVTANCTITFSPNNTGLTASNGAFDASAVAEGTYSVTATATYQSGNGRTLTTTATISMEIESAAPDYSKKYFTTEALEDSTFTMSIPAAVNSNYMTSVSYSTDDGETWVDTTVDSTAQTITTPTIAQGGTVLWKGVGTQMSRGNYSNACRIYASKPFNVSGNIMSLLYGDNFRNQTSFPSGSSSNFEYLFYKGKVQNAENLVLPATTLTENCYNSMFAGDNFNKNGILTTAPKELPATALANNCYNEMFKFCLSLTTIPTILPATTLTERCYGSMFNGCTSLTTTPTLPATTLANYCYESMFQGCTSLTTAPSILPATTLVLRCYNSMFSGCTSLTTAPALNATTLAPQCYNSMFSGCTSLTTAPVLPATTLEENCYKSMFKGCTSLTTAPELPATTLANGCYDSMLSGTNLLPDCTKIDFTSYAVVRSRGLRGLFSGTKVTYNDLLNILPLDNNNKPCLPVTTLVGTTLCYSNMFSGCTSLTTAPELPATTLASGCYQGMFSGCTSLTIVPVLPVTTLANDCYREMFLGCTSLTTAPELPATTLTIGCYQDMFNGCTALTTAPALPATTLANNCCWNMFSGCTSLTTAPALNATTLVIQCYFNMFKGCTNLSSITMLATDISASNCLKDWVKDVAATGTFTKAAAQTSLPTGTSGIPTGWTVVDA